MDPEFLSRLKFVLTASFHFIYPPLSIGLGLLLVVLGVLYLRTRDPKWRQLSFFWVKVYGLVFAVGVATGIVMEFEFGTNWADYSRFVGNIFGSLLAAEGIFAFFLEGGFLGLMLFGGNRLGPRLWLFATVMVAFGAHFSALWIVMANSWMQTPAGYELAQTSTGTVAFMTSFREVIFTPSFIPRILHTLAASWMVGAALVLSVSAFYVLKNRHVESSKAAFKAALPIFVLFSIVQLFLFGAESAVTVTENQPVKLAAMEGLWEDTACAPMVLGRHGQPAHGGHQDTLHAEHPGRRQSRCGDPGTELLSARHLAARQPGLSELSPDVGLGRVLRRPWAVGRADGLLETAHLADALVAVAFCGQRLSDRGVDYDGLVDG
jgi:cytochrome d ubiquinol oxidase subunit I